MNGLMRAAALALSIFFAGHAQASTDWLVKVDAEKTEAFTGQFKMMGASLEPLTRTLNDGTRWVRLTAPNKAKAFSLTALRSVPGVRYVQPNYRVHLLNNYKVEDAKTLQQLQKVSEQGGLEDVIAGGSPKADNPEIPNAGKAGSGSDPLLSSQWGMNDNNIRAGWNGKKGDGVVVAVIDTGVDYTHEDLVENMWRNPGETGTDSQGRDKATNGVDDDGNGYVDDVVGWDFVANDNKPFDLTASLVDMLTKGGNPGHGTHCAGNVAGRGENGKGIAGVAPRAKIMALRFLSEKGEGSTEGAIKAIQYSVKMGVKISSNSWGSEGEDPNDAAANQALRDAIEDARQAGQLFVAAAGNGRVSGTAANGYDNDTDAKPSYPATYPHENIVSVAALDAKDQLGVFSNWGRKTVDIGAPGVKVFSTTSDGKYSDTVVDLPLLGVTATWDGTSMATPHVAGAAALYLSDHPDATTQQIKQAIMSSAKPINALNGKVVTGGKLSVQQLMK